MSHARPQRRWADQATRLRELVSGRREVTAPRAGARIIAVTSGKGGVGKTNVAVNLAICMAARGLRVTLVDADMGMANADLLLNACNPYNLSHVISGLRTLDQVGTMVTGDVFFVPGASGVDRMANLSEFERQKLIAQLRLLDGSADVIILDCGAGISPNVLSFALAADLCLLVATPEPTSLTDAYALIKVLVNRKLVAPICVLANFAESRREANDVQARLTAVAKRFLKYPIAEAGFMLQDNHIELAVRQRCPFVLRYPRCPASACMAAVAGRLAGSRNATRGGGLFRKVVGLFV